MTRLVQIQNGSVRRVARVEEPHLRLLAGIESIYELAKRAAEKGSPQTHWVGQQVRGTPGEGTRPTSTKPLTQLVRELASEERLDYDPIYAGKSPWRLRPPICHPTEPACCLVSGTGLTHLGSAKHRQAMHSASEAELNDSMKMFKWGVEGGKPAPGQAGIAPEWFYKGTGTRLRAHGEPLEVPAYAEDGGEEAELAGVYFIGAEGAPWRIGMAAGNEFSDHKFEKRNYLNLAGSKLRTCSLGPELVIDPEFQSIPGAVKIERAGKVLWSQEIVTGEKEMCHSLANLEHHHFKFEAHRRPGDVHVHYYGACSLSFGAGVALADGDVMDIAFDGFGRSLRNPLRFVRGESQLVVVQSLS